MIKRKDGSLRADYSNTHKALNKQYNSIAKKIKVNESDIEVLELSLYDVDDETDAVWLDVIIKEQKSLYKELEYLEDKIHEIDQYQG